MSGDSAFSGVLVHCSIDRTTNKIVSHRCLKGKQGNGQNESNVVKTIDHVWGWRDLMNVAQVQPTVR